MSRRIRVSNINSHVYLLDDAGESTGYLVVGAEKALVIDTMNGYEDVSRVVREITPLPVTVVNTHGHCDHIYGNVYFDHAYLHPADFAIAEEHSNFEEFVKALEENNLKMPPFLKVEGGHVFDLGGLHAEIIEIPGHTPGGILVLLKEDRLLFTGDAINRHLWLQLDGCLSPGASADALEKLMYLTEEADFILHGHAKGTEPVSLMKDLLKGLREIEAGKTQNDPDYHFFGGAAKQHPFAPGSVICYKG